MKRLRSYGDDLGSVGEKEKEVDRTTPVWSSHHRRYHSKGPENGWNRRSPVNDDDREREGSVSRGFSLRKRVDHDLDGFDEREGSRGFRKRGEHEFSGGFEEREGFRGVRKRLVHENGGFDRRKGFDRYRDRDGMVGSSLVSPRGSGYVPERDKERDRERERDRDRDKDWERERIHRSESFCVSRRDYPKGFRSERHWSKREDGGSSSWRRFDSRSKKDVGEDVKSSPVEKGGSSSSKGGGADSGGISSSKENMRSPRGIKDVKSPTWSKDSTKDSKDSVSEPLKDTKKNESLVADSGVCASASAIGSVSEMEEGELQPELNQVQAQENGVVSDPNVENVKQHAENPQVDRDVGKKLHELEASQMVKSKVADSVATERNLALEENNKVSVEGEGASDRKQMTGVKVANNEIVKGTETCSTVQNDSVNKVSVSEETKASVCTGIAENALANDERSRENQSELSAPANISLYSQVKVEEHNPRSVDKPSAVNKNSTNNFDLEVGLGESNKAIVEVPKDPKPFVPVLKDKGKGVAVSSSCEDSIRENSLLVERNFIACQDDAMEGPSVRGFELFSSSAGLKVMSANRSSGSKSEAEKLKLEPLDLSLGLPNASVAAASHSAAAPPSSPPHARSVQSFGTTLRTGSDCFTASISFSGSQFIHNPSCSLTHNSADYDFEQSVKSRPLFQGVNWQALSANDSLPKEILANSKSVSNGHVNGSLHITQSSQGILNGRSIQQQQQQQQQAVPVGVDPSGILNGRSIQQEAVPVGVDRFGSLQKQLSGNIRYQDDFRSPAQSAGSHDTRSEFGKSEKRVTGEDSVGRLFRSSSQREMEQGLAGERDIVERLIYLIASEHIQTMARRLNEMPERSIAFLKDSVCEVILKEDNHRKLCVLQDVLRKRSDLNLETLLKSHRVQLQILVALKTGLPDYIQRSDSISSSDLAEIYLSLKCRNVNCRSALPVDECDCKFCSNKDGYCSSCMCLVCSKFDTASNTCGWVGCDVCNHWCHTECGLLKSCIRNGRSTAGAQGVSEMQFYCLACDHPSEMFGFVKDVFKTCAPEWKAETFLRELEYVRRIFSASNDYRGKVLHDAAKQLIGRLQSGAKTVEICNQIMAFLNEGDANAVGCSGRDEVIAQRSPLENNNRVNVNDGAIVLSHEPIWSKPNSSSIEGRSVGGGWWSSEMAMSTSRSKTGDEHEHEHEHELDDVVKFKLAEAQLFQKRADAARSEAEVLQRRAITKKQKVEEEYAASLAKLCLPQVEERRMLKHQQLQSLETSHREYFHMKTRMETDIKNLLIQMEATSQNLNN